MSDPSLFRRVFGAFWNGVTRVRVALSNLLFLVVLVVIYMVFFGGRGELLPDRAALLINPRGTIVDQKTQLEPLQALVSRSSPLNHEVLLRDVIDAINYARDDPAINTLVMELDNLVFVGISKTQEIAVALRAFKTSGKPVVAVGDFYSQDQYLLASLADTIIVHPFGGVALEGYSSYRNYFADALEKISVNMHVFKAGEHKSVAEPFLRNDMSPGEKEITGRWLQLLWGQYTAAVEARRKLAAGAVNTYVNEFARLLAEQGGDTALVAQRMKLVDEVFNRDQANEYLTTLVGASNEKGQYEAMPFEFYAARKRPVKLTAMSGERVAVITAEGNIVPGEQPAGTIGGDSLAQLIKTTAAAEGVAAIVLRVNSGGGSVFASEIIRQQLLDIKARGIPVVVSMGAVAASGGYYIAAEADEIWATPATLTGSIGVFAAFPTFEQLLGRIGVSTDGVGTTDLAGALRLDRPLNPALAEALRSGVEFTYQHFLQIVAQGRKLSLETVDNLAQGRVWSADDALAHGLIDGLGTLNDAIAAAASRAGLKGYQVDFVQLPRSPRELFLQQLADRVGSLGSGPESSIAAGLAAVLAPVTQAATEIASLQDPRHLYMRCVGCGLVQ